MNLEETLPHIIDKDIFFYYDLENIDDQIKYTTHKDANVDQIKKTALHEVVHICHLQYPNDYNQTSEYLWIDEERLFNYVMNNLDNIQKVIG